MDRYELLIDAALTFDEVPPAPDPVPRSPADGAAGDRPGDHYNRRATWEEVLRPHGWAVAGSCGDKVYWRRPGKEHGWSATTGYCSSSLRGDLLYVFTTNAHPFEPSEDRGGYSKFEALALLEYRGDFSAAAKALREQGYGGDRGGPRYHPDDRAADSSCFTSLYRQVKSDETAGGPSPHAANGPAGPNGASEPPPPGPAPEHPLCFRRVPISELRAPEGGTDWLWGGYLARNAITLFSALWKAGKTTMLAHLLKVLENGGEFCGQPVKRARVLYVTEEHESKWAERRDLLGLEDHIECIVRPFGTKPDFPAWMRFLGDLRHSLERRPADLVVFDTIGDLWPVKDENDASGVTAALKPLREVTEGSALQLIHHLRKSDGQELTASRGSGALGGFVNILMELRRYAGDVKERRRVLTAGGHYDETPGELVVELTASKREKRDGVWVTVEAGTYVCRGDREHVRTAEVAEVLRNILPPREPGLKAGQMLEAWPDGQASPGINTLREVLRHGAEEGWWAEDGTGKRGSPFMYWLPREE